MIIGILDIILVSVVISLQDCMATNSNVALNKLVTMSTYYGDDAPGSNAVDGQTVGEWFVDGCASTTKENNPWIMVDLERQYKISSIYILNRLDGNIAERLSKVHVDIGSHDDNLTEVLYHHAVINPNITFVLDPPPCGRYVKIWIEKYEYLTICEIEVYGNESSGGNWTEWREWTFCSHSCGNGTASRSRSCTGSDCCGADNETVMCNTHDCPDTISDSLCTYEPRDCQDIYTTWSGVYHVTPVGTYSGFDVFCDMKQEDGGWLIFHRRHDDTVDFNRTWKDYLTGFGEATGNYWLGLRRLKSILLQGHYELGVDLEDTSGNQLFAQYGVFDLGAQTEHYPLIVDGYFGTAGDGLFNHNLAPFSSPDRDRTTEGCATLLRASWWLSDCSGSYLNGLYPTSEQTMNNSYMHWRAADGSSFYVSKASMKIRRF